MFKLKKSGITLVMSVLLVFTSACASTKEGSSGSTAPEKTEIKTEAKELTVAWWGTQTRHDLTLKVIDLFQKKYPNVKVNTQYQAIDGYTDKINVQFSAGNAPDVIQFGGDLPEFVRKGVVLNLDPYVGKALNVTDIDKTMNDSAKFDGKLYGVALGANARGIVVNNTLLQKYGLAVPGNDWTWEDLKSLAFNSRQRAIMLTCSKVLTAI